MSDLYSIYNYSRRYLPWIDLIDKEWTKKGLVANIPSNTKNYYSLISRHNSPYKYQTAYLQN